MNNLIEDEEFEPDLFDIDEAEKLDDDYFHPDDL